MIPIRDTIQSRSYPIANTSLIALNVLVFLWQLSLGPHLNKYFYLYGIVPIRHSDPTVAGYFTFTQQAVPFFASMFMHGGLFHILGNMWSLYIFGDNVEDKLGSFRYLLFYLMSGIVAGLVHITTNWHSNLPTIGASGAIAGVMGAYFILYPRAKILTLVPIFFFLHFLELPAYVFLGFWFLMQIFNASLSGGQAGGIAWWAHAGGFATGILLLKAFLTVPRTRIGEELRRFTRRRSTPRLQRVSGWATPDSLDLKEAISILPEEALHGGRKVINIPHGLKGKTVILTIPPGTRHGTWLRLRGMGKKAEDGTAGDFYLKVSIMTGL